MNSTPASTDTRGTSDTPTFPSYATPNSLNTEKKKVHWDGQEDVMLTGMGVRLPESDTMDEFGDRLLAGEDLTTQDDRRYTPGMYGLPLRSSKVKYPKKFDAKLFGVSENEAHQMDPQIRTMLETSWEAILDAGYNPEELRGSRTGVFVGISASETIFYVACDNANVTEHTFTGTARSMVANRVSDLLDLRGPTTGVDTACSSSLLAFQLGLDAMRTGQCDAALVCGSHFNFTYVMSLQFHRLGMLSPTSSSKSFDEAGDGYARAEGVGAILFQRASAARRSYATVINAKTNCDGYKQEGITYPSGIRQAEILSRCYDEAGLDPALVSYVEAHGTGTKVGDPEEATAIATVFCRHRQGPLLIGSVKSNMGHAETSSGIASVAKVLIAMERGVIPGNLHFHTPIASVPALNDGRLKVVAENTPWEGGYVGINNYGFGGTNNHAIIKSNPITKADIPTESVPYPKAIPIPSFKELRDIYHFRFYYYTSGFELVCVSGRTREGADVTLGAVEGAAEDPHFHALLRGPTSVRPALFPFRGYTLLPHLHRDQPLRQIAEVPSPEQRRPLWFIYTGVGAHWFRMARDMMDIPVFKATILQCTEVVEPLGVNIYSFLMTGSEEECQRDSLATSVCVSAVQAGLTELLKAVGVKAEGIVGHSVGEIAAAYADGCVSLREFMLLIFYRGRTYIDAGTPPGAMAAVGLGWEEARRRCPPGVYAACHNGLESVTVSGTPEGIQRMGTELAAEDIFFKVVDSQNHAHHTPDVRMAEAAMTKAFLNILPQPRKRSTRWLSTSVPEEDWDTEAGTHISARYFVNNATHPVLFYQALLKIPDNAITIEVSPHALLASIIRRSLAKTTTNLGLMSAKEANNVDYFLCALGKLHCAGADVNPAALYPAVSFPVPRGTPSISSLMRWDHSADYRSVDGKELLAIAGGMATSAVFRVDAHGAEGGEEGEADAYLLGRVVGGAQVFPLAGHVVQAWQTLAKTRGLEWEETPVLLRDVALHRRTDLLLPLKFDVCVVPSGRFEVLLDNTLVVSGRIQTVEEEEPSFYDDSEVAKEDKATVLASADVYKKLSERGFEYEGEFRGILETSDTSGRLAWTGNWVTFLDSMLQVSLLAQDSLGLPDSLPYLRIHPVRHQAKIQQQDGKNIVFLGRHKESDGLSAGGVELRRVHHEPIPRSTPQESLEYTETEFAELKRVKTGDESRIEWVESGHAKKAGGELLSVYSAAVKCEMGEEGEKASEVIGMEFAGRLKGGEGRMGLGLTEAMATTVVCNPELSWEIPPSWTMGEAATVPVPYSMAYYALVVRGGLRAGQEVLIHSGAEAPGQAAIAVALSLRATVFTTADTLHQRQFLLQRFPELGQDHVSSTQANEFEWMVRSQTQGRGVNLVLNTLSGEPLQASLRCLATSATFLQVGELDLEKNAPLGMGVFLKNISFHGIVFSTLIKDVGHPDWSRTAALVGDGLRDGSVRPIPATHFPVREASQALLSPGECAGRVVLHLRPDSHTATLLKPLKVQALPRQINTRNSPGKLNGYMEMEE